MVCSGHGGAGLPLIEFLFVVQWFRRAVDPWKDRTPERVSASDKVSEFALMHLVVDPELYLTCCKFYSLICALYLLGWRNAYLCKHYNER
jgi:hypothetical protein